MKKGFTKLVYAGIVCFYVLFSAMTQENLNAFSKDEVIFRANEKEEPDSIVRYRWRDGRRIEVRKNYVKNRMLVLLVKGDLV